VPTASTCRASSRMFVCLFVCLLVRSFVWFVLLFSCQRFVMQRRHWGCRRTLVALRQLRDQRRLQNALGVVTPDPRVRTTHDLRMGANHGNGNGNVHNGNGAGAGGGRGSSRPPAKRRRA